MNVGSELEKLNQLHKQGVLSDSEFSIAKSKLLASLGSDNTVGSGVHLMGKAAYKFVNFKIISAVVGLVIFAVAFLTFFLPRYQKMEAEHEKFSQKVDADMAKARQEMDERTKQFDKDFEKSSKQIDKTRREIEEAHKKMGFK